MKNRTKDQTNPLYQEVYKYKDTVNTDIYKINKILKCGIKAGRGGDGWHWDTSSPLSLPYSDRQ